MDRAALYAFMTQQRYGVLSSVNRRGNPESALMGIAVSLELEIIFDTPETTRKYANLIAHPACSFVIGWQNEQTVQYEGQAFIPQGVELDRFRRIYFAAWPDGPSRLSWAGLVHFVVRPHWVRWSDYGVTAPNVEEIVLQR
jgi:hypothetical protein